MKLLLDTHVWFWVLQSPAKLGQISRRAIEDPANELAVSSISTLEFGQLVAAERIQLKGNLESWIHRGISEVGLSTFEVTHPVALLAYNLPGEFHKDPADRVLVATAVHHGFTLVTADSRILSYPHVMSLDANR